MSRTAGRVPRDLLNVIVPFPSRISPDVDRARTRHLAWLAGLGLELDDRTRRAYEAADFPLFVARTHPWATGDDLDLATDLIGWSWLWDDSLDRPGPRRASPADTAARLDAYRTALAGGSPGSAEAPLVTAWRQLLDRLDERGSAAWRERHRHHWEETFDSYRQEAVNNAAGTVPTFPGYLRLRRAAGGMDICLDWVEPVGRYELPPAIHANQTMLALRRNEQDVVAMTNDLFSAAKEWADGNTDNIVHVLAHHERCSWPVAARRAHVLIAAALNDFRRGERELYESVPYRALPPTDRHNTRRFVDAMKAWMRGSLDWHLTSPRYRSDG